MVEQAAQFSAEAFDSFCDRFRRWANAMLEEARKFGVVSRKFPRWNRSGSGIYMYEELVEPSLHSDSYLSGFHIPEWQRLVDASVGIATWMPQGPIGTIGQTFYFDLRDFALRTLDAAVVVRSSVIVLDDDQLDKRLGALRDLLISDAVSAELVILLDHCEIASTIKLDEATEVELLSDERLDGIVPMLIVPVDVESTRRLRVNIEWHGRCALRHVTWLSKGGSQHSSIPVANNDQLIDSLVDRLQDCLALTTMRQVNVLGWFTRFNNPIIANAVGFSRTGMRTADANEQTARVKDATEVAEVVRLWHQLPRVAAQKTESVRLALRRMRYAAQRASLEDRLLDVAIAAEALFLGGIEDELAFRFSLNASLWLRDVCDLDTSQTFSIFKKAYGLRSGIVHGSRLRDDRTHQIGERAFSTAELVEDFHRLTVLSLKKALDVTERANYAPEWESMLHCLTRREPNSKHEKGT